ncbi:MAG: hypothetical protein HYV28_07355 [Ignavibacteriales bacterium]|nr:hypothetical protein [Ignavibacteriales bacterium]
MRKFLLVLFAVCLISSTNIFSQETDTTKTDDGFKWDESKTTQTDDTKAPKKTKKRNRRAFVWNNDEFKWSFGRFDIDKYPFIAPEYGLTEKTNHNLQNTFNKTGMVGLKLGHQDLYFQNEDAGILELERNYVMFSLYSKDFGNEDKLNYMQAKVTYLGFGWDDGYGYGSKRSAVIFHNGFGIGWNKLDAEKLSIPGLNDLAVLDRFHGAFRFGVRSEGGITLQPFPFLSINANVERSTIFPRLLFWKTGGSVLSEMICHWTVASFVDKILDSTPAAAPIINFILQNGVSYGFSELRKEEANFPFGGESPLMLQTYKVGFTMAF